MLAATTAISRTKDAVQAFRSPAISSSDLIGDRFVKNLANCPHCLAGPGHFDSRSRRVGRGAQKGSFYLLLEQVFMVMHPTWKRPRT